MRYPNYATECVELTLRTSREYHYKAKRIARGLEGEGADPAESLQKWVTEDISPEPEIDTPFVRDAWTLFMEHAPSEGGVNWQWLVDYFARLPYHLSADAEAEAIVDEAARAKFGDELLEVFYEHGHWNARVFGPEVSPDDDQIWAIVDAVPGVCHGLDFEQVSGDTL